MIYAVDWQRRAQEYFAAKRTRLSGPSMRVIRNPAAAAGVFYVIDQIPKVKADLAAGRPKK